MPQQNFKNKSNQNIYIYIYSVPSYKAAQGLLFPLFNLGKREKSIPASVLYQNKC